MSREGNLSLVNLETLFRGSDLLIMKLRQWSKKLQIASLSDPQLNPQVNIGNCAWTCDNKDDLTQDVTL